MADALGATERPRRRRLSIDPRAIAGGNLTATKARLLLMACLLKFGCLPPALDPVRPTQAETDATRAKLKQFQEIFDTH